MRPSQQIRIVHHHEPVQEEIEISSDSEDMEADNEPEVIVISSDSEEEEEEELQEPNQEEFHIFSDLEDGEITVIQDIPTVANRPRIGYWRDGLWCTPGNRLNYGKGSDEGYSMWWLNEPPMDGVEGNLSYVGEGNLFKDTLGGLLYNQWLQNKNKDVDDQVTLGGSMFNTWLDTRNVE